MLSFSFMNPAVSTTFLVYIISQVKVHKCTIAVCMWGTCTVWCSVRVRFIWLIYKYIHVHTEGDIYYIYMFLNES